MKPERRDESRRGTHECARHVDNGGRVEERFYDGA